MSEYSELLYVVPIIIICIAAGMYIVKRFGE